MQNNMSTLIRTYMSVPQKMKKGGLEKAFENKIKEGRKHRVKSQTHQIKSKP